jgi:peptidoglycan hydrolase CwlO-like protein
MKEKMTKKTLIEEIESTQKQLETLSAEQSDLAHKMAVAADDADSSALITLAHRRNNLPIEILSAQIILQRLLLRRDELRLPELQSAALELAKPIPEMQDQINDLQRQFNIASYGVTSANENVRETNRVIGERKRQIAALVSQAQNVKIAPASLQMHGR